MNGCVSCTEVTITETQVNWVKVNSGLQTAMLTLVGCLGPVPLICGNKTNHMTQSDMNMYSYTYITFPQILDLLLPPAPPKHTHPPLA